MFFLGFLVVSLCSWLLVNSCSFPQLDAGTRYISDISPLTKDLNSILLTIGTAGELDTNKYCKLLKSKNGLLVVEKQVKCSEYQSKKREWEFRPDADTTATEIQKIILSKNKTVLRVSMMRNNEKFEMDYVHEIDVDLNGFSNDFSFKYFTLKRLLSTFIIFDIRDRNLRNKFYGMVIVFNSERSNDKFNIYPLKITVDSNWHVPNYGSNKLDIYESLNVIKAPLICCLCVRHIYVRYMIDIDVNSMKYELNLETIMYGGNMDTKSKQIYQYYWHSDRFRVYDLDISSKQLYEPDLSNADYSLDE